MCVCMCGDDIILFSFFLQSIQIFHHWTPRRDHQNHNNDVSPFDATLTLTRHERARKKLEEPKDFSSDKMNDPQLSNNYDTLACGGNSQV